MTNQTVTIDTKVLEQLVRMLEQCLDDAIQVQCDLEQGYSKSLALAQMVQVELSKEALTAGRAALAQQELPQKERPDFMAGYDAGMADAKRMAQQGEPVAQARLGMKDGLAMALSVVELYGMKGDVIYREIAKLRDGIAAAPAPQAQQGEQQPVCHGCGIPAGDVHMSTCKSGKWPSRVSNGDTAAPAPQPAQEPVKFLVNGTRFKMSFFQNEDEEGNYTDGTHVMCFDGYEKVLDGRWVALVAAENDCHLQSTQPKQEPLREKASK